MLPGYKQSYGADMTGATATGECHMPIFQAGLRLLAIAAGAALLAAATPARAAMPVPAPLASAATAPVQPVYWAYDRWGRRVWIERPHYRPPPPRYYPRHHQRRGWVDRYGRWHPYYR